MDKGASFWVARIQVYALDTSLPSTDPSIYYSTD
jgi:hypothetical protein